MYQHGHETSQNIRQAIHWYSKVADCGSDYASNFLGALHHFNDEVQDFSEALFWYGETCKDYKSYSFRGIELLFEHGDGVDQDYKKSVEYYQRSAELENKGGYYNLALMYYHGKGVNQDYKRCFELLNDSVKIKLDNDREYVFVRIKNNLSIDRSKENRVYSFENETVLYGEGYYQLGMMHKNGQGTNQNYDKANECFAKAIEYGNEQAKEKIS